MKKIIWLFVVVVTVSSCIAPRSITNSGKVTPKD